MEAIKLAISCFFFSICFKMLVRIRVWPDPKKGPLQCSSFCVAWIFFLVNYIGKPVSPAFVLEYNAISRWYDICGLEKIENHKKRRRRAMLFPRLAHAQPTVKSRRFLYSLWIRMAGYGYMCMIREHTALFLVLWPQKSSSFGGVRLVES